MKKYEILGSNITAINYNEINHVILENDFSIPKYICVSNVHSVINGLKNKKLHKATNNSWISFSDGKPLSVVGNYLYQANFHRVVGLDFMYMMLNLSKKENLTHYFYGSKQSTLQEIKKKLSNRYGDYILGYYSPPFRKLREDELDSHFEEINSVKPDFIWISLGVPKQEEFMFENLHRLNYGVMVGIGAAFNYIAGDIKRAPIWMQDLSLEWLYRLIQEPRRLWSRYLITNTQFIFLATKELLRHYAKKLR